MPHWTTTEGSAFPLGVSYVAEDQAYNFALYSRHATGVVLHLYAREDPVNPCRSLRLDYLTNKSGRIWHCRLPKSAIDTATWYAYTVEGPYDPAKGHRFDPDKVLLDPYAQAVHFPPAHCREAAIGPGRNAGQAPLGVLCHGAGEFDWGEDHRPRHSHERIIYELHVKGFTRNPNSGVATGKRGTFAGLIDKIPYLRELGVTAVELMPVFQFDPEEHNYWGYMTLDFFAPHHLYACDDRPEAVINEFKSLIKALHAADIEVILDVVYNHTTEEGTDGPTYCYRGIDNSTYYLLEKDKTRYRNDAGTGNVFQTDDRAVRTLVLDSLRHWVTEFHVDGFRFDLASIFTRRADGSIDLDDPPMIAAIRTDPVLARTLLIAEAWDITSYQLGHNFPGLTWLQWNGRFRDDLRCFVKGDGGLVPAIMARLYGSDDLFPDRLAFAYHAYQSVNFLTAHDGFTLYDLVSYDRKHNRANGEDNRDGSNENYSWNCGIEGDDGVTDEMLALRYRQVRNFCCLLLLANGTPMLRAGDEFLSTQGGNNNPYNQDNETTWLDWQRLDRHPGVHRFFRLMIAFRKAHPSLARSRFWRRDVRWYGPDGPVDFDHESRSLAFCLRGTSQGDDDLYVMINAGWQPLSFTIQDTRPPPNGWLRVVDTGRDSPEDIVESGREVPLDQVDYEVGARSVVVLLRRR